MPIPYSGEFGSAHIRVRRELLLSRGLKEGLSLEHGEKRVLHSTHRATLYLTAGVSTDSFPLGPSNTGSFHPAPSSTGNFIHSERYVNASSNGSIGAAEMVPDRMEGQGLILLDGLSKGRRIMDGSNVQQGQEEFSHVSSSFYKPWMVGSRHQEALLCLSASSQNSDSSATSNFTSLPTFHGLMLHIPSDTIQHSSGEFCEEDAEAPSTPDLRPEVRSRDNVAPCTVGADEILPENALFPKDLNDVCLEDNCCPQPAGIHLLREEDIISTSISQYPSGTANNVLTVPDQGRNSSKDHSCLREEDTISTSISQCPSGTANNVLTVPNQGRNSSKDHNCLSGTACRCSNIPCYDYRKNASNKRLDVGTFRKQDRRSYFLLVSALGIHATPYKKELHLQLWWTLQSHHGIQRSLRWEWLKCWDKILCEHLFEGIRISLQNSSPVLVSHPDDKAMEAKNAEWYSNKQVLHKHVHGPPVNQNISRRNGHTERTGAETFIQEKMFMVLHLLSEGYLATRRGDHSWRRCLCPDQDHAGNLESNQCGSVSASRRCLVSASRVRNLLEDAGGMLPRVTQESSVMIEYLEQGVRESHTVTCSNEATGILRRLEDASDANSIHIEEVEECPNNCLSNTQAHPSSVISSLMQHPKLVASPVIRSQPEDLNFNYPNDSLIGGNMNYPNAEGGKHKSSCLPVQAAKGPCRRTSPLCGISSDSSMQGLRPSMPHGGGAQERQSREKLERFAEVFLLRRHIIQQQQRAQRAPPFPTRNVVAGGNMNSSGNGDHEPTPIHTPSSTKAYDMGSAMCGRPETFTKADVVIDIVELVKYLEGHSNQLEILTCAAANSYERFASAQSVLPNVGAVIVSIAAFVAYTKAFLEDAVAWVESQAQREEAN